MRGVADRFREGDQKLIPKNKIEEEDEEETSLSPIVGQSDDKAGTARYPVLGIPAMSQDQGASYPNSRKRSGDRSLLGR